MGLQQLKIGFDGRLLLTEEIRGFSRYTMELVLALRELYGEAISLYAFSPQPLHPYFRSLLSLDEIIFSASREILWEQYELPRQLRRYGIDVFHATGNRGLPAWRACTQVLTLHDMIENMPQFVQRAPLKPFLRQKCADAISIACADKIITVSEHSRRDIHEFWKVPVTRMAVIHNGVSSAFFERVAPARLEQVRSKYGLPANYVLYLGGFDRKKNVCALLHACARTNGNVPPVVLAGDKTWGFSAVAGEVEHLGLNGRVITPGKIDDADLPALCQSALAFVYPSLYEGFGLQLVEAMASGLPVLASERSCFPEILDGAGLLFNPEDPENIAECIRAVAQDRGLRESLAAKSIFRARQFSWRKSAEQTMQVYQDVRRRTG